MYFGATVAPDVARDCLTVADELGARSWDTANNYGFWTGGDGNESESVLGDWFATRGADARDRVVLVTKIGARPSPGYADLELVAGLSAPAVREQAWPAFVSWVVTEDAGQPVLRVTAPAGSPENIEPIAALFTATD